VKVLICTPDLTKSGGVGQLFRTLKGKFDVDVEYFVVGSRGEHEGFSATTLRIIADFVHFTLMLVHRRYDVVHINPSLNFKAVMRDGILLLLAKALRCRVIIFFHGWNQKFKEAVTSHYLPLFRAVFSRADAFIVLASSFRRQLIEMGITKPIHLTRTSVEDELVSQFSEHSLRAKLRNERTARTVLFLSRIERGKGIYEALDAFAVLRKRRPEAWMDIVGDGAELAGAMKYVELKEIHGVRFFGHLSGPAKYDRLRNGDIYFLPTHSEGMPISVLEAMAAGIPVVTRPVGGLPDFFQDGKMGFLSESSEPEILAGFLERLLSDARLREEIALRNFRFARKEFTSDLVAHQLSALYRSLKEAEALPPGGAPSYESQVP
jgi:glycosyltransferase involved in cell wall biosynthesis